MNCENYLDARKIMSTMCSVYTCRRSWKKNQWLENYHVFIKTGERDAPPTTEKVAMARN